MRRWYVLLIGWLFFYAATMYGADRLDYINIPSQPRGSAPADASGLLSAYPGCSLRTTQYPPIYRSTTCYDSYKASERTCQMWVDATTTKAPDGGTLLHTDMVMEACPIQGRCDMLSYSCIEGPETRMINGVPVYQACWRWEVKYGCIDGSASSCQASHSNCLLVSQNCISYSTHGPNQGYCDVLESTYSCQVQPARSIDVLDCGGSQYRMVAGKLASYTPPYSLSDMSFDVAAQLSDPALNPERSTAFGMAVQRTTGSPYDIQDNPMCHTIGATCTKRLMGVCVEVSQTACCASSSISLAVNEIGRSFLNKGWGTTEYPNCTGFTSRDWQSLDLSVIDTSVFRSDMLNALGALPSSSEVHTAITRQIGISASDRTYVRSYYAQ